MNTWRQLTFFSRIEVWVHFNYITKKSTIQIYVIIKTCIQYQYKHVNLYISINTVN